MRPPRGPSVRLHSARFSVGPPAGVQIDGVGPPRSGRSHARACVHLPSTVLTETPRWSATSGTDRPEKNLNATTSAPRISIASRRVSALSRARRSSTGTGAVLAACNRSSVTSALGLRSHSSSTLTPGSPNRACLTRLGQSPHIRFSRSPMPLTRINMQAGLISFSCG